MTGAGDVGSPVGGLGDRFKRRPRSHPEAAAVAERARRDAANLTTEFQRLQRWASTIANRGRETFLDPGDETNYLAAQAVVINLAEALERRTPDAVIQAALPEGAGVVRGMRNRLAHDYLFVDKGLVWDAISRDVPHLLDRLLADGVVIPEHFVR